MIRDPFLTKDEGSRGHVRDSPKRPGNKRGLIRAHSTQEKRGEGGDEREAEGPHFGPGDVVVASPFSCG